MIQRSSVQHQKDESLFVEQAVSHDMALNRASAALVTASHYAVQKRILVPAWWLAPHVFRATGTDFSLGECLQREDWVLTSSLSHQKYFHVVAAIWNELFKLQASGLGAARELEVPLDKLLRGTSSELSLQMEFLEQVFGDSYRCVKAALASHASVASKKSRQDAAGGIQTSAVWRVFISRDEKPKLVLSLACTLNDFLSGRFFVDALHRNFVGIGSVVSLNPDVLRAFAQGRSQKKLNSYLLIETAKRRKIVESQPAWNGGIVSGAVLASFHKELMGRTKALYDHGVFGWEDWAPRERISQIRKRMSKGPLACAGVLHVFRVSDHALAASRLEDCMSLTTSAPSVKVVNANVLQSHADGMSLLRSSFAKELPPPEESAPDLVVEVAAPVVEVAAPVVEVAEVVAEVAVPVAEVERHGAEAASQANDEFLVKMMEYLESLSADEQEALMRERNRMNKVRFRNYMARKLGMRLHDLCER